MNAYAPAIELQPGQRRRGQTLVIAIIVLAVVLLLGFVFLGVINHNINNGGRFQKRSAASELAEAGVRYVHNQMLYGELGADWRGLPSYPTPRADLGANFTSDPDAFYTRPASGLAYLPGQTDLGGPDGLGFYTRINFANGRALVRVRYAPSDANIFLNQTSSLQSPGRARSYVIIESIGRQGALNFNDPTTLNTTPVQFQGFANATQLQAALGTLSQTDAAYPTSQKQTAFVSIGIIEDGLYVTNKDRVSHPMDLGFPEEVGARFAVLAGNTITTNPVEVPQVFGQAAPMYNLAVPPTPAGSIPYGGSIHINGDVEFNGTVDTYLNYTLGDAITTSGTMTPVDNGATVNIQRAEYEPNRPGFPAAWYGGANAVSPVGTIDNLLSANLSSRGAFGTDNGIFRDGTGSVDPSGFTRNVGYKAPPSMELRDPQTGANRFLVSTQQSGANIGSGNSGRFGHGAGIYIDNLDDIQIPTNDVTRAFVGSEESLVYDWLNPNNGQVNSGWQGPFYTPYGAYLQLDPTGFTVTRDAPNGNAAHEYWSAPDGTTTNISQLRFRVGYGTDGLVHVVNALTNPTIITNINDALTQAQYQLGPIFNGVLYFEGNVRVRGVIPTDVQLSVVSGATIYIEGSIVRGEVGSDIATDRPAGQLLTRPSRSSMMLMARDYVALNTTQFFGPGLGGANDDYPGNYNSQYGQFPIRALQVGSNFTLQKDFLLNPSSGGAVDPYNPSTWLPFDGNYTGPGGNTIPTEMILSQAVDTGTAAQTFLSVNINTGLPTSPYLFPLQQNLLFSNGALNTLGATYTEPGYVNQGFASVYGLGFDTWQTFPKYETVSLDLIVPANFTYTGANLAITGQNTNDSGTYSIVEEATNNFTFRVNSIGGQPAGSYLMARAAITPSDIRIEASIYAEEGSFFVIPGPWFNPNPNDTRIAYLQQFALYEAQGLSAPQATTATDNWRQSQFGTSPGAPFNGEPLDVKISIFGSVSENVTPPISQQAEWLKKWGWIPIQQGAPSNPNPVIPVQHSNGFTNYAPNLIITYDPILGTGRVEGFAPNNATPPNTTNPYLRYDAYQRPLAPMPRLPVSPVLAYFGEQS